MNTKSSPCTGEKSQVSGIAVVLRDVHASVRVRCVFLPYYRTAYFASYIYPRGIKSFYRRKSNHETHKLTTCTKIMIC